MAGFSQETGLQSLQRVCGVNPEEAQQKSFHRSFVSVSFFRCFLSLARFLSRSRSVFLLDVRVVKATLTQPTQTDEDSDRYKSYTEHKIPLQRVLTTQDWTIAYPLCRIIPFLPNCEDGHTTRLSSPSLRIAPGMRAEPATSSPSMKTTLRTRMTAMQT